MDQIVKMIPVIVAAIPGIIALLQQLSKQKAEAKIKDAEKDKQKAEATKILTEASSNIQDQYRELIEDIKLNSANCKEKLEELVLQNVEQNKLIKKQGELLKEAGDKINSLERRITILTKQLHDANINPLDNGK